MRPSEPASDLIRRKQFPVIAHRLATVQRADGIVVMDHGQVVAAGTHAELLVRDGLNAQLAALHFSV